MIAISPRATHDGYQVVALEQKEGYAPHQIPG